MPIFCSYRFLVYLFLWFYYANIIVREIHGKSIFSATTDVGKCGKVSVSVKDCFIVQSDIHCGGSWCCLFYVHIYKCVCRSKRI